MANVRKGRIDKLDEDDVRIRPSRSTRPRTKDRPTHAAAIRAQVITVDRGRVTCIDENGTQIDAMKARELGRRSIAVGDWVGVIGDSESLARVVRIENRKNALRRSVEDGSERTIVANVDYLIIVAAAASPDPRTGFIDRALVAAYTEDIQPVIVMTKSDLADPKEFLKQYEALHIPNFSTSKFSPDSELANLIAGKVSVFIGHSGVGKSTLINTLSPEFRRETGEVNEVTGRGRHTSSSAIAFKLATGGWVIDTPGVRSFGLSHVGRIEIIAAFPDLNEVVTDCQKNCSHDEDECKLNIWQAESNDSAENLERTGRVANLRRILASLDE
jgi:ribosome biogenesis GTPase